jgi:general secretion pathway protein G
MLDHWREAPTEGGFTLIELMIVMVVIGVLGGIVLFGLGGFQSQAEDSRDGGNAKQCATAIAIYKVQHAGESPTAYDELVNERGEYYLVNPPSDYCGLAPTAAAASAARP